MANSRRTVLLNRRMDAIFERSQRGETSGPRRITNRAVRRFLLNRLAVTGMVIFGLTVLTALFAPLLAPYDPLMIDMRATLAAPSAEHWLGTDKIGRDVFSRILYGGRMSILVGLGSALGAGMIGVTLGVLAGYLGGWFDAVVYRASELFLSFPQIILVLMLVVITGQSVSNLVIIFVLTGWGSIYRMARSQVLSIREEDYITALRAFGINPLKVAFKHILPNAMAPIAVNITLSTAMFILQESSLSFLGLGVPMEVPTWGNILNAAKDLDVLRNAWWMWLPVGAVIALFVLSINFIGDGLRDATDPSKQG